MKTFILTHPVKKNYGGILQAYALCEALKILDQDVTLINGPLPKLSAVKSLTGKVKLLFSESKRLRFANLQKFINNYLPLSAEWHGEKITDAEAIVVGSDQVWRPGYTKFPGAYFLDFASGQNIKRIAYAASFGVDYWEFSDEQTTEYGKLLKKFDHISVREVSGIDLCKKYFQLDVQQMPDPTLLHNADFYRPIANNGKSYDNTLFTYFLDRNDDKEELADTLADKLGLSRYDFMPADKKTPLHTVEDFLAGISKAEFILTDSFHGMVFSMIFNKKYAVYTNIKRGLSRFDLTVKAGAEQAILTGKNNIQQCIDLFNSADIYTSVPDFLQKERQRGWAYLQECFAE